MRDRRPIFDLYEVKAIAIDLDTDASGGPGLSPPHALADCDVASARDVGSIGGAELGPHEDNVSLKLDQTKFAPINDATNDDRVARADNDPQAHAGLGPVDCHVFALDQCP